MKYVLLLAAGGFATSTAEYFLKYNLIDLIKDKVQSLLGLVKKAETNVKAAGKDLAK